MRSGYFPVVASEEHGVFKRQLVRAAVAGIEAMRAVDAGCRFVTAEPVIHVAALRDASEEEILRAEERRLGQYESCDMLLGLREPELGGRPDLIDAIGLNFYPDNQWYFEGSTIPLGHHDYRPLADMLAEVSGRYDKPLFLAETGAEGSGRAAWLHYVCDEVREATARGAEVAGICLYPVTAYPGWDNSRHAEVGLFTPVLSDGERGLYRPLADELDRQQRIFAKAESALVHLARRYGHGSP